MKLIYRIIILTAFVLLGSATLLSQSTNQDYPTPVTSTEISGTIKARDIGDARLTSYYYQFDGSQGDLFLNIVTRNFTGDIDVFTLKDLRPLTKIVVYADFGEHETGRVIYLRKPEKMILRVQGRTPGDDAAAFRIKFAGSFVASTMTEPADEPGLPSITARNESGIRVNSVGTIIEVIPKATPIPPQPTVAEAEKPEPTNTDDEVKETPSKSDAVVAGDETEKSKVEVVVTDNLSEKNVPTPPPSSRGARNRRGTRPAAAPAGETPAKETPAEPATDSSSGPATVFNRSRRGRATPPPKQSEPEAVDPLQNVNLVILFKDGSTIQRPMSEVLRFSVDKGILTVVAKDGTTGRYSILDVAKVTIE